MIFPFPWIFSWWFRIHSSLGNINWQKYREINFKILIHHYDFLAFIFPSRELKSDENWGCHNNMITIEIERQKKRSKHPRKTYWQGIGEKFISSRRQTGYFLWLKLFKKLLLSLKCACFCSGGGPYPKKNKPHNHAK